MPTTRRLRSPLRAALFLVCLLTCGACATLRPAAREARRDEAAIERLPPPLPAPTPDATAAAAGAEGSTSSPLAPRAAPAPARPFTSMVATPGAAAPTVVELVDDLLFAPSSAQLDAAARARLAGLAARVRRLEGAGGVRLEVQGHSDDRGDEIANLQMSLRRAEAVRRHLVEGCGLPPQRISVIALGSRHPAADNATAAGRARNRRAVVFVLR